MTKRLCHQPGYEVFQRNISFVAPCLGVINNGIADIMGNPVAGYTNPSITQYSIHNRYYNIVCLI